MSPRSAASPLLPALLLTLGACTAPGGPAKTAGGGDGASGGEDGASDGNAGQDGGSEGSEGGDSGLPCDTIGALSLDTATLSWHHWGGEPDPVFALAPEVRVPACRAFVASTDAPWLGVELSPTGEALRLQVRGAEVPNGRHRARVELRDLDAAALLASVELELSALGTPPGAPTKKALIIGIDGMDGEEMAGAALPTLDLLSRGGTSTRAAGIQATGSSYSGPSWTSVLTGVEVSRHGVTSNGGYSGRDPAYPTFVGALRAAPGLRTVGALQWAPVFEILESDALDDGEGGDRAAVVAAMQGALRASLHDLHVLHLDDVDHAGHAHGFLASEPDYRAAMEQADADVGTLLDAILQRPDIASEDWLIVVTSDHGGDAAGVHGPRGPDYEQVPLIVVGGGAPILALPAGEGNHLDVAPTVLDFFGRALDGGVLDGHSRLRMRELDCEDGLDDDEDGLTDCDDADCARAADCWACRVDHDLGEAIGVNLLSGQSPAEDHLSGACGGAGGDELIVQWRAPADGRYGFDTMEAYRDTVLYLRDGDCAGAELACNDDRDGVIRSAVAADLVAGQAVSVVIDSAAGASGPTGLSIYPHSATCPDGDLGSATGSHSTPFSHSDTVHVGSCPPAVGDRWWSWQAPAAGTYTLSTAGSSYDTVLYALDACGGAELACNDDFSGGSSQITLRLAAGERVVIGVGSFAGRARSGTTTLQITGP